MKSSGALLHPLPRKVTRTAIREGEVPFGTLRISLKSELPARENFPTVAQKIENSPDKLYLRTEYFPVIGLLFFRISELIKN